MNLSMHCVNFNWSRSITIELMHLQDHIAAARQRFQYLDVVTGVESEPVVDSSRQNDEVAGFYPDPNPTVLLVSDIKVSAPFQAVADLFVPVYVLRVEVLELLLVVVHFLRAQIQQILRTFRRKEIGQRVGLRSASWQARGNMITFGNHRQRLHYYPD